MKFLSSGRFLTVCIASLACLPILFASEAPVSHARVVRLSYVSGTVGVKRAGAAEWSKALVNTPIQEGFEVSTAAGGFAEIEFENGSTARLGELSRLTFDQLALNADGDKMNRMTFEEGYATFHFLPEKHDTYSVKVADATVTPSGKSVFRTDVDKGHVRVEVFNGTVQVAARSGSEKLGKDKTLEFDTSTADVAFNTRRGMARDSWDKWTEARDSQANLALNDQAVAQRGPVYGWSDLDAYGEWAAVPGFGYGWSPYAPVGWSPYSMGMWGWYPGMGYTWISSEPWGWLPYHYGLWNYSAEFGWFWIPGDFGFWSPALVSWYTGPGWIGWMPLGLTPPPGLGRPLLTASATAVQTGQLIAAESVGHAEIKEGTLTQHLPFEPPAGTTLMGPAMGTSSAMSKRAAGAPVPAPSSILMGVDAGKESALLGGRPLRDALRMRLGTTLGGRYKVDGTVGEFHGDAFQEEGKGAVSSRGWSSADSRTDGQPKLNVLPHGQSAGGARGDAGEVTSVGSDTGNPSATPSATSATPSSHAATNAGTTGGHH